ncbi:MAG: DUF3828 domain-containing protein [Deltaproteobacteria bacterium]|nr:DUF3828 domain-containing protein [Deltaproteobacteria bacterium]
MRRSGGWRWVAAVIVVGVLGDARAEEKPDRDLVKAVHVVRTFYTYHLKHDMSFTEGTVAKRKEWLAPDFYRLLLAEVRRPTEPGEAPFVNGDPFTDSQEYPTRAASGRATRVGVDEIDVEVTFFWTRTVREYRQYRWESVPVEREVEDAPPRALTVKLTRGDRLWRIADLVVAGKSFRAALEARNEPGEALPRSAPGWMSQPTATDPLAPPPADQPAKPWQPSATQPWQR